MKAIVQEGYGRPSRVLHVRDVDPPALTDDAVLVRVHGASLNAMDWHAATGRPLMARATLGVRGPKQPIAGTDLAGVVEAVGPAVPDVRVGDEVFGTANGSLAELVATRARRLVPRPASLSLEEAAALPVAGATALMAVRERGALRPGESVLVLGAGGGVGSFAVQLALADGGRVTAETGPASLELVASLGAERVMDRSREDVLRGRDRYDLVIDAGGFASGGQLARVLSPRGRAVIVGAGDATSAGLAIAMLGNRIRSRLGGHPIGTFLARITRDRLLALAALAEDGRLRPAITETVALDAVPATLDALLGGRARGKVAVRVRPA